MEQIRSQDQQQKDFLAYLFPEPSTDQHRSQDAHQNDILSGGSLPGQRLPSALPNFSGSSGTSFNQQPLDLMAMSNLMSMQGMDTSHPTIPSASAFTPQMLLEQQYKLTQLHQLQQLQNQIQNQIFQQQLALISGQAPLSNHDAHSEPQREQVSSFNGLPTPLSSTEIRPLPNPDFLPRINPPYSNSQQDIYGSHGMDTVPLPSPQEPAGAAHYRMHPGTASAPANIVFQPSPSFPLPSPSDLDIDISPLTSPWLDPYQQPSQARPTNKRTASPGGEDNVARMPRKRPTTTTAASKKVTRPVKSATSTPLLRSTRARRNSTIMETDSPSPVDLSMPPPAPPGAKSSPPSSTPTSTAGTTSQEESRITPVTPASIMNLGRLGISSGLMPASKTPRALGPDKGKDPAKPKATADSAAASKGSRKSTLPLISPGPKPILPAGSPASLNLGSSALSQPAPLTRKSHKDAEQKRRDSLKTAYDDLRILLPPIPLPSDENFPDEPILPGALPPRGPPKAGGDGPNKGVSKLQLLRCGNDYIRQLKGRVDRRDSEIANLRREVLRLRVFAGDEANNSSESIDLELDIDAVEAGNPRLGQSAGDDDGDDGDD
ncbi:hypothetical protein HYDPIDRAFT_118618 [Hydnomerulius pinastri MD-312]|uniref:BHLH domain-containing protein n=1 Tax=Hydnomerulius pinastri MD-312 TaxID=994086 RepID=A0A0C9W973_9AGAM|nr:hypothetical protein HYDPIDRAFT_118618 [Hydnomerulius pinastri MD-312]